MWCKRPLVAIILVAFGVLLAVYLPTRLVERSGPVAVLVGETQAIPIQLSVRDAFPAGRKICQGNGPDPSIRIRTGPDGEIMLLSVEAQSLRQLNPMCQQIWQLNLWEICKCTFCVDAQFSSVRQIYVLDMRQGRVCVLNPDGSTNRFFVLDDSQVPVSFSVHLPLITTVDLYGPTEFQVYESSGQAKLRRKWGIATRTALPKERAAMVARADDGWIIAYRHRNLIRHLRENSNTAYTLQGLRAQEAATESIVFFLACALLSRGTVVCLSPDGATGTRLLQIELEQRTASVYHNREELFVSIAPRGRNAVVLVSAKDGAVWEYGLP